MIIYRVEHKKEPLRGRPFEGPMSNITNHWYSLPPPNSMKPTEVCGCSSKRSFFKWWRKPDIPLIESTKDYHIVVLSVPKEKVKRHMHNLQVTFPRDSAKIIGNLSSTGRITYT